MTARALGFDRTVLLQEDRFGRNQLVRTLYDLLVSRDADWSVRVALNGDWGSGKTSIAEMVGDMAKAEGHAVGWLYPWRVTSSSEVATALTGTVLSALDEAGIELSVMNEGLRRATKGAGWLDKFRGLSKIADFGIGILQDAGAFDIEFAVPIATQLKASHRRLLIVIDDLDRCEPAFLPSLLLFMRTALDVPGFSFLCPFDSDIVAKTLAASNKAWSSADRFLEKVFDFRIPIPDLTAEQKQVFLASQLAHESIQVDQRTLAEAASLLPGTPRALKALARDLGMSRLEYSRRLPQEIDWTLLVMVSMLRAASLEFFRAFRREVDRYAEQSRSKASQIDLTPIWDVVGRPDEATVRRVNQIAAAMIKRSEGTSVELLRKTLHFTDEFEPVTWMEFDSALSAWSQRGMEGALRSPPLAVGLPRSDAPLHLASLAITRYAQSMEELAGMRGRQTLADELRQHISGQERLVQFLLSLLPLIPAPFARQRFDLFSRLYAIEYAVRKQGHSELEPELIQVLQGMCQQSGDDWPRYDEQIRLASLPDQQMGRRDWNQWHLKAAGLLRGAMVDRARDELVLRLQRVDGFAGNLKIGEGNLPLLAQVFLDPVDPFWTTPAVRSAMSEHWQPVIGENLGHMFGAIFDSMPPADFNVKGYREEAESISRVMESERGIETDQQLLRFLKAAGPVGLAWQAYVRWERDIARRTSGYLRLFYLGANLAGVHASQNLDLAVDPQFSVTGCKESAVSSDLTEYRVELTNDGADANSVEVAFIELRDTGREPLLKCSPSSVAAGAVLSISFRFFQSDHRSGIFHVMYRGTCEEARSTDIYVEMRKGERLEALVIP